MLMLYFLHFFLFFFAFHVYNFPGGGGKFPPWPPFLRTPMSPNIIAWQNDWEYCNTCLCRLSLALSKLIVNTFYLTKMGSERLCKGCTACVRCIQNMHDSVKQSLGCKMLCKYNKKHVKLSVRMHWIQKNLYVFQYILKVFKSDLRYKTHNANRLDFSLNFSNKCSELRLLVMSFSNERRMNFFQAFVEHWATVGRQQTC